MHHDFWLYWCQLLLFFVVVKTKVHHIYKCPSHEQVHLSLHNVYQQYADSLLSRKVGNMPFSKSLSPYLGVSWVQILPVNSERGKQLITTVSKCQEWKAILKKKHFEHRWIPLTRDELRKCILEENLNVTSIYRLPFPQVQYGTKKKYSKHENAMIHTYTLGQWHGLIYDAILWDLKPNERYYYRVGDKTENCWSTKRNFKAPPHFIPLNISPFSGNKSLQGNKIASFATFGDMSTRPTAQQFIKQLNKDHTIDFCVHIGDFGYAEYTNLTWDCKNEDYAVNKQAVWDKWFRMVESITSSIPFMAGIGNHEAGILDFGGVPFSHRFFTPNRISTSNRQLYKNNIEINSNTKLIHKRLVHDAKSRVNSFNAQPHKNPWYWFEYGPFHCIVISSEHTYGYKSLQRNWLRRHLAQFRVQYNEKNVSSPWLIVFVHRCIYSSAVDEVWHCILIETGNRTAHGTLPSTPRHSRTRPYERTFPIKYGVTYKNRDISGYKGVPVFLLSEGTGPIYLRVGCAGLEIEPVWVNPLPKWSAYLGVHFGYARIVAYSNSSLHVEYVVTEKKYQSKNSNVLDKIIIIKS